MTDPTVFTALNRKPAVLSDYVESLPRFEPNDSYLIPGSLPPRPISTTTTTRNKYKNIILDMDGTLLDYIPVGFRENPRPFEITPIARPHLLEFMEFVFDQFERVSIWTAATPRWFEKCYKQILRHHIPEGRSFHFVKTRDPLEQYIVLKPLSEIYKQFPGEYNSENTLVIDDNPMTYRDNPDNAVEIKAFFYDKLPKTQRDNLAEYDSDLLAAIEDIRFRLEGM